MHDPFARLIRQWETLHPYNFVDVLNLANPVPSASLASAANATLNEMLGMSAAVPSERGIDVEGQLAHSFQEGEAPVRIGWGPFSAEDGSAEDAIAPAVQRIAFTFRHAFFDGLGAATFVKRTVRRTLGERLEPFVIVEWRERIAPYRFFRSVRDLIRMRRVDSRGGRRGDSPRNRVRFVAFDHSLLDRLRAAGALHDATVNDVLATRLAAAMRRVVPPAGKRRETAIAIAVGMRGESEPFARGVAVAWFPVFAGDEPVLESIRDQTAREKQSAAWLRSRMEMRAASVLWPWITPEERERYFARQYVVTAGLTNLRLDGAASISNYRRAVATGPVAPLVVTALTVGECLSLAITWRSGRFRDDEIDAIESVLKA